METSVGNHYAGKAAIPRMFADGLMVPTDMALLLHH